MNGTQLKKLSRHCWERWDAAAIKASACEEFQAVEYSPLRLKILGEAIDWLGSRSAFDGGAFDKLIQFAIIDCWEAFRPPIHSSQIAYMAISSLILTDWEEAIARSNA
jgi:hypothetical protein